MRSSHALRGLSLCTAVAALTGCWSARESGPRPAARPRQVREASTIVVESIKPRAELMVHVSQDNQPSAADARISSIDPSYRLLTLQLPNGHSETFKISLAARLDQMAAGDPVTIRRAGP